jgi:hypothetical protein
VGRFLARVPSHGTTIASICYSGARPDECVTPGGAFRKKSGVRMICADDGIMCDKRSQLMRLSGGKCT